MLTDQKVAESLHGLDKCTNRQVRLRYNDVGLASLTSNSLVIGTTSRHESGIKASAVSCSAHPSLLGLSSMRSPSIIAGMAELMSRSCLVVCGLLAMAAGGAFSHSGAFSDVKVRKSSTAVREA